MILEGIITTVDAAGEVNVAPLGAEVGGDGSQLRLRPFQGGRTFDNLRRSRQGVFHVIDDVQLLADAATGNPSPRRRPAEVVNGFVLESACQTLEIEVTRIDDSTERSVMDARVVRHESRRDFFGWNRGKHAVLEAAILITRAHLLPEEEIRVRMTSLRVLVEKTGGSQERGAFRSLETYLDRLSSPPVESATEDRSTAVRVRAGARVHFGLMVPGAAALRQFGGTGLMLEEPGLEVTVERAADLETVGELAERAAAFAQAFSGQASPPYRITARNRHPDHVGLGTGTQLGLAVARGIATLDQESLTAVELAARVGRGRRSAVGVHGFERGGMIVEAGKKTSPEYTQAISSLVGCYRFPDAWRVVLIVPRGLRGASGGVEEKAFSSLEPIREEIVDRLSRLALLGMIPALLESDIDSFGEALYEYGRRSGECFAPFQSSAFASPEIAALVRFVRAEGVRGVGQSSWGPAVYAVVESAPAATALVERLRGEFSYQAEEIIVSRVMDRGADVERLRSMPSLHTLT